jgi:hypothetical protein
VEATAVQQPTVLFWLMMLAVVVLPALLAGLLVARPVSVKPHGPNAAVADRGTNAEETQTAGG